MRDILVLSIIFGSLPVCFFRPWIGILVFSWVSYMNPHRFTWGIAYDFPVAMIVAVATIAGFIFTKDKSPLPRERETYIMFLLWIFFTLTTFNAINPDYAWPQWEKVSKVLLMTLFTILLINDKKRLRCLLLVIALSIGFLGIKGGVFGLMTGGQWRIYGPPESFIGDNNDMALALNMSIPLLWYLSREETNRRLKIVLNIAVVFSIISVILTFSRGGFVALSFVFFLLFLKSKRKFLAGVLLCIAIIAGSYFIPEHWYSRMETIETYEEDASAMGRINAWHFAWNLASDRLLGGGFETFTWRMFEIYAPEPENVHDAHSVYFEILGEQGFIGLGLFLVLIITCFISLSKIKKLSSRFQNINWMDNYSNMIQVSLAAYAIGGLFLGRAYFDMFYHLVAAIIIMKVLARKEVTMIATKEMRG